MRLKIFILALALNVVLFTFVVMTGSTGTISSALADATTQATQDAHAAPHWGYEGQTGPTHWGDLSANFGLCNKGVAQSPIDLDRPKVKKLADIVFNYKPSALTVLNNGHTIQVNYDAGSSITVDDTVYKLIQFHFHHPSEHTLGGETFPMELHLVHSDSAGNLAVVGLLLREGKDTNSWLEPVLDNMPTAEGQMVTKLSINAADFLPTQRTFFTYTGSLTTPPCTEGVRWLVLATPVELSSAQIKAFSDIFKLNARPVQKLNTRDLLLDAYSD